jgi:uncharacterized protein (DUF1501 family)
MIRKAIAAALLLAATAAPSFAALIDFEDQSGPSFFGDPAQTLVYTVAGITVTFSGGTILDETANLPANQTSVYGTVGPGYSDYLNPITITFSQNITNFFLDVLNGETTTTDYVVSDNAGNTQTFSLIPNLSSGVTTIGIAATGNTVTIASANDDFFDFFIDNVRFNEALPPDLDPSSVPLPAGLPLLAAGLAGLGMLRRRKA